MSKPSDAAITPVLDFTPDDEADHVLADPFGWDAVNAVDLDALNAFLAKAGGLPTSFAADIQQGWSLSGQYGPWAVATGGDGQVLWLRAPVVSGTMTALGQQVNLAGAAVIFEVRLAWTPPLPPPTSTLKPEGTRHDLRIDASSPVSGLPPVVARDVEWPGASPGAALAALATAAFQVWVSANPAALSGMTFASITLNRQPASPGLAWLSPTSASYAYTDGTLPQTGAFALLIGTLGRDTSGLGHVLSRAAVPAGLNAALLVNMQTLFRNSVLPGLPAAFDGAKASDFQSIENDTTITNVDGATFSLPAVAVGQGQDQSLYSPAVVRVEITAEESQIVTALEAKVNLAPGVDLYVDVTSFSGIRLTTKTDGTPTLDFFQVRDPIKTHRIEKSVGAIVTEEILSVALTLFGAIGGALAKEVAAKVAILILISLVKGAILASTLLIQAILDKGVQRELPSLGDLVSTAFPGGWTGLGSPLDAQTAGLNLSLQIGGSVALS